MFTKRSISQISRGIRGVRHGTGMLKKKDRNLLWGCSVRFQPVASMNFSSINRKLSTALSSFDKSEREEWAVNLRGADEQWLNKPRGDDWYTGVVPRECPGVDEHGVLRSMSLPDLRAVTHASAKDYFNNSWTLYEMLFAGLKGERPFYEPPYHGLRHSQMFYYGHTPCLYVNKMFVAGVLDSPVDAYLESIFEVGVDEMVWDDMQKNDMIWPDVSEVHAYRKNVYRVVMDVIDKNFDETPRMVRQDEPLWSLFMGFEHERIHFETSSVLFREMQVEAVQTPASWPPLHPSSTQARPKFDAKPVVDYPVNEMIAVEGSVVNLGKPREFPSFGWDNEYGSRKLEVGDFSASKYMISNGEFHEFVTDGGYREKKYWCTKGWEWRKYKNLKWPFFWEKAGPEGSYKFNLRTIFKNISMQWDWPVDVNYYEAKAYCKWKTLNDKPENAYRVITEAEHQLLRHAEHSLPHAREDPMHDKVLTTSGEDFPKGPSGANLNLAYSSQSPVNAFPPSNTGHHDVAGNAWEWTEDNFNPLDGFRPHKIYDDFSTPCFDGQHSMIMGGSFMSTGDEASVFARFHFRPHFLQHSGFRLAFSQEDAPATRLDGEKNVYEKKALLDMYLGLHFPSSGVGEGVDAILDHPDAPNHGLRFPQRVGELLCGLLPKKTNGRVLDLGCAVGGTSFWLAKHFDEVEALDFSDAFISAAKEMQNSATMKFDVPIEADITKTVTAVHEPDAGNLEDFKKINFFTGDACKLPLYDLGKFDGVVLSNLLCRLPNPLECLDALADSVNEGGVVVMVTPFSWLEEFTPKNNWIGGYVDEQGKDVYSSDKLTAIMEERGFKKIHDEEMPVVIKEHQRKYQYIVSHATGWRKI